MLVVDIRHWLTEHGELPTDNLRVRRNALHVARLIEYGGPLKVGHSRETLVDCTRRPGRQPCLGLMWVVKTEKNAIYAYCPICKQDELMISGWEHTLWAEGMMEPVPPEAPRTACSWPMSATPTRNRNARPTTTSSRWR